MNINGSDYTLAKVGKELTQQSESEIEKQERLLTITQSLLGEFGHQWNAHALVAQKRQTLSRILYYNQLYQKILEVPGVICEFGVQWGATLTQMINLRGMYEPYNVSRKIIGFDTFSGFPNVNEKDGGFSRIGDYSTTENYEQLLDEILTIHESLSPLSHIRKFELVKGDASLTIEDWLVRNPHAIISMAIFDMDVYKPTKTVLEKIIPRLVKGSVLVFDELNCQHFPGETLAVQEVLGLNNLALRRHPHQTYCSWAVFGE